MLKLTDLALRSDLQLGPMLVSPSRRLVEGPGGYVHVEPLIMQVFLLLLDAGGKVVTRNELFDQCWGGVYVGDDSLNRAILRVRRTGAQVAPGLFEIETIPRTGYRITGEILRELGNDAVSADARAAGAPPVSRRVLIGSGAALAAVGGAAGLWWLNRPRSDPRFDALMQVGSEAERHVDFDIPKSRHALEQAVRMRPDSARAWGLLAFVRSISVDILISGDKLIPRPASPAQRALAIAKAQDTARRALAMNPKEPNGLLAMFELQGSTLDWFTRDQRIRQVISLDPTHMFALLELISLTQSLGMNRESWDLNERALAIDPMSPDLLCRRALKHWIAGRVTDADNVIDLVRDRWPDYPFGWWVQFLILATTGRAPAASAMLDRANSDWMPPPSVNLWKACLPALGEATPAAVAKARQACLEGSKVAGELAAYSVMILSGLKQVDAAFEVAIGFLLWRGQVVRGSRPPPKDLGTDNGWRAGVQWLFTPPCAALRADPRFMEICDGIGLTDYWRRRGVKPDYMLAKA
jgi:DNA-binding winged helix-turn-helix (wHTH) protein